MGYYFRYEKDDSEGFVYHDPFIGKKALVGIERGFDLVSCHLCVSFIEGHTAKGIGLRVADSFTSNHRRDDFTPLENIQSINETPAQKAAKRRKLNEHAQEAKDLKNRLEVVDDEDDYVFTEATPLARKVPVVDYHIVLINNKPRYKIIKADETHQLYISFVTLLKNFDREDQDYL
nr:hypothetical protein [Tanacetum cinerariifolium]GEY83664.1 hypothetical protein [Tanacetum cinerariifolium]